MVQYLTHRLCDQNGHSSQQCRNSSYIFHAFLNICASHTVTRSEVLTALLMRILGCEAVSLGEWLLTFWETFTEQHGVTSQQTCTLNIVYAGFWLHKYRINQEQIKVPFFFFTSVMMYCTFSWHANTYSTTPILRFCVDHLQMV